MSLIDPLCDAHAYPNNNSRQNPCRWYANPTCLEMFGRESEGRASPVTIEVVGKVGAGKSSLVANFFEVADCKTGDRAYPTTNEGMERAITVWIIDTPGLGGIDNNAEKYLQKLFQITNKAADVILYCVSMHHGSRIDAKDVAIIKALTGAFGKGIWEHMILFLTCEDTHNVSEDSCANTMINYRYTKQFEKAHVFNIKAASSFSKDHPDHHQSLLKLKTTDLQNTMGSAAAAVPRVEVGSTSKTPILVPVFTDAHSNQSNPYQTKTLTTVEDANSHRGRGRLCLPSYQVSHPELWPCFRDTTVGAAVSATAGTPLLVLAFNAHGNCNQSDLCQTKILTTVEDANSHGERGRLCLASYLASHPGLWPWSRGVRGSHP